MAMARKASLVCLLLALFIASDVVVDRVKGQLNTCTFRGPRYFLFCGSQCPVFCRTRFLNGSSACSGFFFFRTCFCTYTRNGTCPPV